MLVPAEEAFGLVKEKMIRGDRSSQRLERDIVVFENETTSDKGKCAIAQCVDKRQRNVIPTVDNRSTKTLQSATLPVRMITPLGRSQPFTEKAQNNLNRPHHRSQRWPTQQITTAHKKKHKQISREPRNQAEEIEDQSQRAMWLWARQTSQPSSI